MSSFSVLPSVTGKAKSAESRSRGSSGSMAYKLDTGERPALAFAIAERFSFCKVFAVFESFDLNAVNSLLKPIVLKLENKFFTRYLLK